MISVIIPAYNRAHYLGECIESVLRQTYTDIEIIVVDDGSTDDTKERLSVYGDRIRYIYKPNGGLASARNEGLRHARGGYIAWLDSDDKWQPYKLALQVGILEALPETVGFIHSDFSCFTDERGTIAASYMREYLFTMDAYKLYPASMYDQRASGLALPVSVPGLTKAPDVYWGDLSRHVLFGPLFLPSTVLMRRSCVEKVGWYRLDRPCAEDYEYLALAARYYHVAFVDIAATEYRRFHADQLSSEKMEIVTNESFLQAVTDLGVNDHEYYAKNRSFVQWRLSHNHYAVGLAYYRKKQYTQAWHHFMRSLSLNLRQRKVYIYACAAFMRRMVQSLLKRSSEAPHA